MSSHQDESTSSSGSRSFLQQTTSQRLHELERLRRRRELLERASRQPPAMRFGLGSPANSRSPAPRSVSPTPPLPTKPPVPSFERKQSMRGDLSMEDSTSTPPPQPAVQQPPMRFSMSYRPTPTPSAIAFTASMRALSVSPAPLEVNKVCSRGRSQSEKRKRQRSSGRSSPTPSPRHQSEEASAEDSSSTPRGRPNVRDIPVSIFLPKKHGSATPAKVAREESTASSTKQRAGSARSRDSNPQSPLKGDDNFDGEQVNGMNTDAEVTTASNVAASKTGETNASQTPVRVSNVPPTAKETPTPKNTFPLPQYSPSQAALPRMSVLAVTPVQSSLMTDGSSNEAGGTNEFPTPRPLIQRISASGLPLPPAPVPTTTSSTPARNVADDNETTHHTASCAFSNGKPSSQKGSQSPAPVPQGESSPVPPADREAEGTQRRKTGSPAPTTQNLIESVMAAASTEKRPCGCDRPTVSPRRGPLRRPSRTDSPPPTPVNLEDELRQHRQDRQDGRPTPASLVDSKSASTNAALVPPQASSPSPWPTTDNIVQSIAVSADKRRARERDAVAKDGSSEARASDTADETIARSEPSTPADKRDKTPSPSLTPRHIIESVLASAEKGKRKEEAVSRADTTSSAGSPALTDAEISTSVLVAAAKLRAGRPTRVDRAPVKTETGSSAPHDTYSPVNLDSASPIPTTEQLLDSLAVTAEKKHDRSDEPTVERQDRGDGVIGERQQEAAANDFDRAQTPSPVPTSEHVEASVLASADKRQRRPASVPASKSPPRVSTSGATLASTLGIIAPPPAFPTRSVAADNASVSSAGSPMLTADHIDASVRRLVDGEAMQAGRSHAQAQPKRNFSVTSGVSNADSKSIHRLSPLSSGSPLYPSPLLTATHIKESMNVIADAAADGHNRRSGAVPPARKQATPPPIVARDETEEVAEAVENTFSNRASKGDEEETGVSDTVDVSAIPPQPPHDSQSISDVCADSDMFKDCVSAGPTPALPHIPPEFLALQKEVKAISEGRSRASRSTTPIPPRNTSTSVPPTAPKGAPRATEDFVAASAAIVDKTLLEASAIPADADPLEAPEALAAGRRSSMVLVAVGGTGQTSYPALIQEPHMPMPEATSASRTPPPPPISIPRTPTPPPPTKTATAATTVVTKEPARKMVDRDVQTPASPTPLSAVGAREKAATSSGRGPMLPDSHYEQGLSPLPRPVTLSSQVGGSCLPSSRPQAASTRAGTGDRLQQSTPFHPSQSNAPSSKSASSAVIDGPTPVHRAIQSRSEATSAPPPPPPISVSPREGRSTPFPRGSVLVDEQTSSDTSARPSGEESGRVGRGSVRLWSDRDGGRTFTISPQGNAVIVTEHDEEYQSTASPSSGKKRGRMVEEVVTPQQATPIPSQKTATTPVSNTTASSTPLSGPRRSGGGGRRSTVEKLLAMLPEDTQEELRGSMELSQSDNMSRRDSGALSTQDSRISHDGDEVSTPETETAPEDGRGSIGADAWSDLSESGTVGSIAERVGRRPRKAYYDYDYYLKYVTDLNRSSAKKVRNNAAKRMHQKVLKDVESGRDTADISPVSAAGKNSPRAPPREEALGVESPSTSEPSRKKVRAERESRVTGRLSGSASGTTPLADIEVSPLTESSSDSRSGRASGGKRKLNVTTRLSAELSKAIFDASPGEQSPTRSEATTETATTPSTMVASTRSSQTGATAKGQKKAKRVSVAAKTTLTKKQAKRARRKQMREEGRLLSHSTGSGEESEDTQSERTPILSAITTPSARGTGTRASPPSSTKKKTQGGKKNKVAKSKKAKAKKAVKETPAAAAAETVSGKKKKKAQALLKKEALKRKKKSS